jgi:hypothetical protein
MDASGMHGLTWQFLVNEQPFHKVVQHLMAFLRSLRALHDDPLYMLAHTGVYLPAVHRDRAMQQLLKLLLLLPQPQPAAQVTAKC